MKIYWHYFQTVTPEFREAERLRAKARHDEAQALFNAEEKGREEGRQEGRQEGENEKAIEVAKNAMRMGLSTDDIVKLTGLTREDIESLRK